MLPLFALIALAEVPAPAVTEYAGTCDASGVVAVGPDHFLIADDESSVLHLYQFGRREPVKTFDLTPHLALEPGKPEVDLEAAARVNDRAWWLGSHSADKKRGRPLPNRRRLLATDLHGVGADLTLTPAGPPYKLLVEDFAADSRYNDYHLADAARLSPEEDGLNIEGLAATPAGTLLIGFRSPVVGGKALVAELLNPDELLSGKRAKLGPPVALDLGGLGGRSIDYSVRRKAYLIAAGPAGGETGEFRLYQWSGGAAVPAWRKAAGKLGGLKAEALLPIDGSDEVMVISDDGARDFDGVLGKNLPESKRFFRTIRVTP